MRRLILSPVDVHAPTQGWQWAWAQDDALGEHGQAALALLPSAARGVEVVLVWPLPALSWQQVQLPAGSLTRGARAAQRLRQILDGLLEDSLLDEPAALHLALAPGAQTGAAVWVAVCARAPLVAALDALAGAGLALSRIVPEAAPLAQGAALRAAGPPEAPTLSLSWPPGSADGPVLALPWPEHAAGTLDAAVRSAPEVWAEPALAQRAQALAQGQVVLQPLAQVLLRAALGDWNLAQFDLAQRLNTGWVNALAQGLNRLRNDAAWRPARWALGALLLVQIAGLNFWAWQTRAQLAAQRAQAQALFRQTFPRVPVVVDASAQMTRELHQLARSRGAGADTLDAILQDISAIAPHPPALLAIDFVADEWRLTLSELSPQTASALRARWLAAGWQVRQDGARWLLTGVGR